ncbi:MAG: proprotein convertase P-domain-containing protein, partial [Phycisphaerae bacterium]
NSTITVPDNFPDSFAISDVDVQFTINHANAREVEAHLISPAGTDILLFTNVPRNTAPASNFTNTLLNDEGTINITDPTPGVVVSPFLNVTGYVPEELLSTFDGQNSSGTWRLIVQDTVRNSPPGAFPGQEINGTLVAWDLILTRTPAKSGEILLSTTTTGNQMFSSVAMDRQGEFTIAWSGNGAQTFQEDNLGVFYQQFAFNGEPIGSETLANVETDGRQWIPSIGSDGPGNFVVTWTGDTTTPGATDVFRFLSTDLTTVRDIDGPVVTDVFLPSGRRIIQGDALETTDNITELTVALSEDLSVRGGDTGPDSVLNPENWVFRRNGVEMADVVTKVDFALNPLTRKYEAVLSLDGNGLATGITALPEGNYVLTVRDTINDAYTWDPVTQANVFFLGNALDGDFDGTPGTSGNATGFPGYKFQFTVNPVTPVPNTGAEFRINMDDPATAANELHNVQRISEPFGTGFAREQSTRSVAVDHDGDFVAVWTSYGQDDPSDPGGAGVYARMYNRDNVPLTDEFLVNTDTVGHQRNASVAIDADGEFVVVWEAENDNVDGSWGVYGRRFNSVGDPLGGQFRVNTNVQNDQLNPAVAMDDFGNFVVVWASKGQSFSFFNDVRGQLYNYRGERIGSEFLVNEANIPGTASGPGSIELNPAVAMDDDGFFVVAWDQITAQQSGVILDSQIVARMFDNNGVPDMDLDGVPDPEFVADNGAGTGGADIERVARNPQVVIDDQWAFDELGALVPGTFTVVWESYLGNVVDGYEVFFQQFDGPDSPIADGQVNEPAQAQTTPPLPDLVFDGNQVNASIALDADGDFTVVWNGKGAQPDPLNPTDLSLVGDRDNEGVFLRQYNAAIQFASQQSRVNRTSDGIQQFGSVGMERDGDMIVVWSGMGVGDHHGIFARRYNEPTDTAGPLVSDLRTLTGERIEFGAQLTQPLDSLVVVFDEEMMTTGPDSVRRVADEAIEVV